MPQLTVYIDEQTLKRIESAARVEDSSISKWVKRRLEQSLNHDWPVGYSALFGSLGEADLQRPAQPDPKRDAKRDKL